MDVSQEDGPDTAPAAVDPDALPPATVIVPVYNDAEALRDCLAALCEQTYPSDRYEVVVVDNNSEEDIDAVLGTCSQARLVRETTQGSYAARNRGIRSANGTVLAFTDADCVPAETWLVHGTSRLVREENCGLVGGRIDFTYQRPGHPSPPELYDSRQFLKQELYVKRDGWAATANAFTRKAVFEDVGLFEAGLQSGGDTEWGRRVSRTGYRVCYEDRARVRHPARSSFRALRKKKLRIVGGTVWEKRQEGYPLPSLMSDVVKNFGHHVRFALRMAWTQNHLNWTETAEMLVKLPYQGALVSAEYVRQWAAQR
jgi:glycosyltransferase involved in cell wall biosynthesis